jgi:hypothetical protein
VFDAFVTIYRSRVADLIRMVTGDGSRFPDRDLHPDPALLFSLFSSPLQRFIDAK